MTTANIKNCHVLYSMALLLFIMLSCCTSDEHILNNPRYYGTVINSETNEPYSGVSVSITNGNETRITTKTDSKGYFEISINVDDLSGDFYILIGDDSTEKKRFEITGVVKSEIDLGVISIYPLTIPAFSSFSITSENEKLLFEGQIVLDDNWDLKEVGICYGKNNSPTINDTKIVAVINGNSFHASLNISDLELSSVYYFKGYAINYMGVGYSNVSKYETLYATPKVEWLTDYYGNSYTNLTPESVTLYALASSEDWAYKIIETGFCYSTQPNPTIQDNVAKSGYTDFWSQNYEATLIDLSPSTKYYVRPYAINSKNVIGYGADKTIETLSGLATLKITDFGWDFGGYQVHVNIEDYGGGTINRSGVCYSTKPNPDITDDIVLGSPGLHGINDTFSVYVPISKHDAIYYVRAFAETQYGISYSQQESLYTP